MPLPLRNVLAAFSVGMLVAALGGPGCQVPGSDKPEHFPLKDAHKGLACGDCHGTSLATPILSACISCHLDVRPPDHDPHDCGGCHTPTTWLDVVVDHEAYLSLQGGHAPLACEDCHSPTSWQGLNPDCESCHEPDRPVGHFEGGCAGCHNVSRWGDAIFDHRSFFPIPHNGVKNCDSCHPPPEGTSTFTCIDCHEHNQPDTDRHHRGFSRYRYESAACLDCHPRGDD